MRPDELSNLLLSMSSAADIVEAFDYPVLQKQRGWNLADWTYDLVPWGVRFDQYDGERKVEATVFALVLPENLRAEIGKVYCHDCEQTKVLLLG